MNLTVRNRTYKLKTYDQWSGADQRRLTLNMEMAVEQPSEFSRVAQLMIPIVCPSARKHLKQWTEPELRFAVALILTHLAEQWGEGEQLVRRYTAAAVIIKERFAALYPPPAGEDPHA